MTDPARTGASSEEGSRPSSRLFASRLSGPQQLLGRTTLAVQALGLDAVGVALVWQAAFGRVAHDRPPPAGRVGLALVVAWVYILDRQLDVARALPCAPLSPRHHLHARFPRTFRTVLAVLTVAIAALIPAIQIPTLTVAGILGCVIAVYLAGVQFVPRSFRGGTKELTVGLVFATGCAAHALPGHLDLVPTLLPTGLLFALNCVSISTREAHLDARQNVPGLAASPRLFSLLTLMLTALAAIIPSPLSLPIFASAALLLLLHHMPQRTMVHRLAADAALLTPLLLLAVPS